MKKFIVLAIVLFLQINVFGQATEYEKNIKSFELDKMNLGYSLSSFKNRYPNAEKLPDKAENVGAVYYRVDNLTTASYGFYRFFNNKLIAISLVYTRDYLSTRGGIQAIVEKLVEKIGQSNNANTSKVDDISLSASWEYNNRYIEFNIYKDGDSRILLKDENAVKEISKKQANNIDLGF